jgi:hypothetical protein
VFLLEEHHQTPRVTSASEDVLVVHRKKEGRLDLVNNNLTVCREWSMVVIEQELTMEQVASVMEVMSSAGYTCCLRAEDTTRRRGCAGRSYHGGDSREWKDGGSRM